MPKETTTEKIIRIMQDTGIEFNAKGMALELRKRKTDVPISSVRKLLSRLYKDGIIVKTQRGFYKAKNTSIEDFKLISQSGIDNLITNETKDIPQIHRLFLTFSAKNIREWLETAGYTIETKRDKSGAGGVSIPSDLIADLTNVFSPDSLFQRYITTHTSEKIEQSDMYQDTFSFTASPHRSIVIQTYATGSVNVIISCSQDPLQPTEFITALFSIDLAFQSLYGYSFIRDLLDLFFMTQAEFNRDGKTVEVVPPAGSVITIRELEDWAFRYYSKDMEDGTVMREEYIYADGKRPPTASQFLLSLESAIQGGINVQYLVYNTKQLYDAVRILGEGQQKLQNAVEYALAENRRIMREMTEMKKKGGKRR